MIWELHVFLTCWLLANEKGMDQCISFISGGYFYFWSLQSFNFCCNCKVHWCFVFFFPFIPVNHIHVFTLQVFLVYIQDVRCLVLEIGCQQSQGQERTNVEGERSLIVTPHLQNLPTPSPGLPCTCHYRLRCQRLFFWVNPVGFISL